MDDAASGSATRPISGCGAAGARIVGDSAGGTDVEDGGSPIALLDVFGTTVDLEWLPSV